LIDYVHGSIITIAAMGGRVSGPCPIPLVLSIFNYIRSGGYSFFLHYKMNQILQTKKQVLLKALADVIVVKGDLEAVRKDIDNHKIPKIHLMKLL
jgi:hypothetical protein